MSLTSYMILRIQRLASEQWFQMVPNTQSVYTQNEPPHLELCFLQIQFISFLAL